MTFFTYEHINQTFAFNTLNFLIVNSVNFLPSCRAVLADERTTASSGSERQPRVVQMDAFCGTRKGLPGSSLTDLLSVVPAPTPADFPMSAGITPIIPAAACECECTSSLASRSLPPAPPFSPPPPVQVAHFPACQCWLHFCDNPHNNEMIGAGSHSAPRSLCWRRTTSVHSVQEGPRTPSPLLSPLSVGVTDLQRSVINHWRFCV